MTTIVTGGTKGIGLAIADRLARSGRPVVLGYGLDEAAAAVAVARLKAKGANACAVRADVGTIGGAAALIDAAAEFGEGVDALVHSAAMIYPTTLLEADLER